jgi:CBS domain-containing protein
MVALDKYPHIRADYTLEQALETISTTHIQMHGEESLPRILLVFDEDDTLLGLLRRRDILKGLSPRWFFKADAKHPEAVFETDLDENIGEILADKAVSRFRDRSQNLVGEYIQEISGTVDKNDSLIRLVNIMVKKNYHMLPVMDDEHVIGVVRSVEVLWAVNALLKANGVSSNV